MDIRLSKFIQSNKNNNEIFKTFLTHFVEDKSNVDRIYSNLKEIAVRYISENYKVEIFFDNGRIQFFCVYLRTNDHDLYILLSSFQGIRSEIIAILMRTIMDLHNLDSLFLLVLMMSPKDVEKYLPGICNFCFSTLEKFLDPKIIQILTHVLYQQEEISKISEEIITNYFINNNQKEYHMIWYVLILRFETFKKHFICKLLISDFLIREEWYKTLNDNIEELLSSELIYKLMEKGKFEFNRNVFEKLKEGYYKDGNNKELIMKIQTKYLKLIKNPVVELMPVSSVNSGRLTTYVTSESIKRKLKRVDPDKHGYSLVKIYLTSDKEFLINVLEDVFNIKELFLKYNNRIFEWLYYTIEQLVYDYEIAYDDLYNSSDKDDSRDQNMLQSSITYKKTIENDLKKYIKAVRMYIKVLSNADIDDITYSILSILHLVDNFMVSYEIFLLLKVLLNNENELDQSLLKHIFDEIIHYDIDNFKIRILKYEIFNVLLLRWFVFEKELKVHSSLNQTNLDFNYLKNIHEQSSNLLMLPENDNQSSKTPDKNNIFVLCSRIWKEIKEKPKKQEIGSVVDLMTMIITLTGRFYQRRFFESSLLNEIGKHFTTLRPKKTNLRYVKFLEKIIMNFNFTKNSPKLIFECIMDITRLTDDKYLLDLMVEKHPLYAKKMLKDA
ncbi:hypothetical protein NBO_13g0070 [Nosema bombycis CQ1]|uniref:Uncharacterized protein n=1 Tax=Nosema bombycis (strain CQ1 / CVCC 102059) TaxID=578461 RepID=R0MPX2_NOSB1|nr:hypothetical protein NBO_13g0070 [Nosema bombycis CQ1]|eukprot:EOB14893.1 hypothetical protein NBO_13g0070 [Nosema bombycis CQ1]